MSPTVFPLLIVVLFVVCIGLLGLALARASKLATENVRRMAETLGLEFTVKPPALGLFYSEARAAGQLRGKQVELFPFATGSGKSRIQWCAVSAAVPVAGSLTFHLRQQGFGTKVMELFGAREISVGEAEFDRTWFIQTNQPEFFREALLPELRDKISALLHAARMPARSMELKLDQNVVRYAEIGSFSSADSCTRCLRAAEIVCDLADLAEVAAGQKTGN